LIDQEGTTLTPETWLTRLFQGIRFLWVILCIVALYFAVIKITPLIYPFIISLIIAIIVNRPVTNLTERLRFPRWLSVTVVLLLLLLIVTGVITLVINTTVNEIGNLVKLLPRLSVEFTGYIQNFLAHDFIANLYHRFQFFYTQLDLNSQTTIDSNVKEALHTISNSFQTIIVGALSGINAFLLSLPSLGTVFVISLLGAFFLSKDFYLWKSRMHKILPTGVNHRMDQIVLDLRSALVGFLKAQLTLISITAAIVIIGLLLLRVEYAITIGLLTGLVDLLPYLGTGTVFVPWIIFLFFKGQYGLVVGLSVLYGIVVIFRQIIEPKIVAESVGLDPLLTLVALFAGLELFGVLGLIIGPVSLVIINALVKAKIFEDLWMYIVKGKL